MKRIRAEETENASIENRREEMMADAERPMVCRTGMERSVADLSMEKVVADLSTVVQRSGHERVLHF